MIGDKIVIKEYNRLVAKQVLSHIHQNKLVTPYSITISGESGSGKTEAAVCLKEFLEAEGKRVFILGQDDYFRLPPHTNNYQRKADIKWVGINEVDLDFMNYHLKKLSSGKYFEIVKPLIEFEKDKRITEIIKGPYDVVIAEGTYTALLKDADIHAFIDRNYHETKKDRLARNRDQSLDKDPKLEFLETVLEIEHQIIKNHKKLADIIIPPHYELNGN